MLRFAHGAMARQRVTLLALQDVARDVIAGGEETVADDQRAEDSWPDWFDFSDDDALPAPMCAAPETPADLANRWH
jgi:hypothetical protein